MRNGLLAPLLTLSLSAMGAATAVAEDLCRQFSWSVGRRIDLFDDYLPTVENRQSLPKDGVFVLRLAPAADVIYLVAPERGQDSGYGGVVTIESLPAGRYQIALSQEAWVDAVQDNHRLPILAGNGASPCPGVRRSIEVVAEGIALSIQIGGARVDHLSIAVARVWPFEWRW